LKKLQQNLALILMNRQAGQRSAHNQRSTLFAGEKPRADQKKACKFVEPEENHERSHAGRGQETKWEIPTLSLSKNFYEA